jgi:hypothetical protein
MKFDYDEDGEVDFAEVQESLRAAVSMLGSMVEKINRQLERHREMAADLTRHRGRDEAR